MINLKKFLPGIAWFCLVLILICLPGYDLPKVGDWMSTVYFDKWIHVGMFSVLAFLFMIPFCKSDMTRINKCSFIIKIAISISIWGLTTEFIQKFFIPGRSFDLLDWAADSVGVILAVVVCRRLFLK